MLSAICDAQTANNSKVIKLETTVSGLNNDISDLKVMVSKLLDSQSKLVDSNVALTAELKALRSGPAVSGSASGSTVARKRRKGAAFDDSNDEYEADPSTVAIPSAATAATVREIDNTKGYTLDALSTLQEVMFHYQQYDLKTPGKLALLKHANLKQYFLASIGLMLSCAETTKMPDLSAEITCRSFLQDFPPPSAGDWTQWSRRANICAKRLAVAATSAMDARRKKLHPDKKFYVLPAGFSAFGQALLKLQGEEGKQAPTEAAPIAATNVTIRNWFSV